MKSMAAREAKNRFGQLIDDAQREPVTIVKNGRPFAVVQSYDAYQASQDLKLRSLKIAIEEARAEYAAGVGAPFDKAALDEIKAIGRQRMMPTNHEE